MSGFEWDDANTGHISRHDITPSEVEEMFMRKHFISEPVLVKDEERRIMHGTSNAGRLLTVITTERKGRIRPITARDMARKDRREYGAQLE